ncbi:putative transcription factor C3H family [Medicago truncatula]|nr:zinc finger CCCH domain-containing protein 20 [Medicago truncatula]AES77000.1 zinc finger CCCH domain protein [Medicago truncatula]RHN53076.1 putative transcription factor C3H family [Medicago truncatula]UUZ30952.1 salt tolerant protein [Medicago sativa]
MMLRANPTVHVPPWPNHDDPTAEILSSCFGYDNNNIAGDFTGAGDYTAGDFSTGDYSSGDYYLREALAALQRYLPSNEFNDSDLESPATAAADSTVDAYSCDHFRMYEFKIRRCARGRSHDWTECPYAHPGEKARRRDPRKFHYSGTACPDFRKGNCKKGDACEHAHGVFECWLHPARYRTQPCKDGTSCRRRVCFFAHTPEQLRLNVQQSPSSSRSVNSPDSYDGSPLRQMVTITTPPESPPMSPMASEMVASLRNLQLGRMKTMPINRNVTIGSPVFGSGSPVFGSPLRSGFLSLPNTPTKKPGLGRVGGFDLWDQSCEEEPIMERVESGRDIRAKMFEKLSKENSLENENGNSGLGLESGQPGPDVGWVCDLLK